MKMKRLYTLVTALLLTATFALQAEIVETNRFTDLRDHISKDTLILLDIDNTIMEPTQALGSDQWFHHRINHYKKKQWDPDLALETALAEWMSIQNVTRVKLVEKDTAQQIRRLQSEGYTVMGFTTRGLGLSTRTIHQLGNLHVDLSLTAPSQEEIHFMNGRGVLYRGGILFTAGSNKGTAFEKFIAITDLKPTAVVFINDKSSDLQPVEAACSAKGIPFIGLRYGATDDRVNEFRDDLAEVQMEQFGHIVSDEAAEEIVKNKALTI